VPAVSGSIEDSQTEEQSLYQQIHMINTSLYNFR